MLPSIRLLCVLLLTFFITGGLHLLLCTLYYLFGWYYYTLLVSFIVLPMWLQCILSNCHLVPLHAFTLSPHHVLLNRPLILLSSVATVRHASHHMGSALFPPCATTSLTCNRIALFRCLYGSHDFIEQRIRETVKTAKDAGVRHVLNLGHGVLPTTPEENVAHYFKYSRELKYADL